MSPAHPTTLSLGEPVHARVAEARRRLVLALAAEWLGRGLLVGASAMLAAGAIRWFAGHAPLDRLLLAAGFAAFVGVALYGLIRSFPSAQRAAAVLDAAAGARDRFSTALAFEADANSDRWKRYALEECAEFARAVEPARFLPLRAPWFALWALAPLLFLGLLQLLHESTERDRRPTAAETQAAQDSARALQQLADLAAEAADEQRDEALAQAADLLQQRAARLQERAGRERDAAELTRREMANLAEMLRELREQAGRPQASADELAALADALSRQESTRSAAEAIRSGNAAEAGKQLEELLRRMKERGDAARQMQDIARSMQEPAGRLTEKQKSEIAQQMQQAAQAAQAGRSERMQQLLQRLAELLKQQPKRKGEGQPQSQAGASGQGKPQPLTEQSLEQLIKALEQMKKGGSPQDATGKAQQGMMRLQIPQPGNGQQKSGGQGQENADSLASGNPGGEKDAGTSKRLFDDKPAALETPGAATKIEGALGDGASLQEFLAAPGGAGEATRKYRELYDAMAPAAQEAIEQERIPIGARRTVKRYFESIRPKE
ncbi:MAG: hypothetical protein JSR82_06870 [Verrucomicrobia bacterium]|nr:hypothetical protein [Verrucomicrobiota bacterium]